MPTRTTIPRTIPHQDNSPLGPLPRNKTTHQDQDLYGGELSSWGVVRIWSTCISNVSHKCFMQIFLFSTFFFSEWAYGNCIFLSFFINHSFLYHSSHFKYWKNISMPTIYAYMCFYIIPLLLFIFSQMYCLMLDWLFCITAMNFAKQKLLTLTITNSFENSEMLLRVSATMSCGCVHAVSDNFHLTWK